jgi:hypothetical protein
VSGCALEIAGNIVVRSKEGALEAEYALFDASEIELRATEYGAIREVGYRTTVADALARLDAAGATTAIVRDLVAAVQAAAKYYAPARALPLLGILTPAELLAAERFDPERRVYVSPVLDVARLTADAGPTGAAAALQAAGLAAWLRDADPDTEVALRTADYMTGRRPGERSIRRVSLSALRALPAAIAKLKAPRTLPADVSVDDLVAWLKRRNLPAHRQTWAELAITGGRSSSKGPLAEPRAVAIDVLLDAERSEEALPLIDRLEIDTGRTNAIQYLRLRAALARRSDPPPDIAERAMSLFAKEPAPEVKLLAARAWSDAGQAGRAAMLAGEVLADPEASNALKNAARALVEVKAEVLVEPMAPAPSAPEVLKSRSEPPAPRHTPSGMPSRMRPSAPALVLDLPPRPPSPSVAEISGGSFAFSRRPTPIRGLEREASAPPEEAPRPFIMGVTANPQPSAEPTVSKAPTPKVPANSGGFSSVPTRAPPMELVVPTETPRVHIDPQSFEPPPPTGSPSTWPRGASMPPYQSGPPPQASAFAPGFGGSTPLAPMVAPIFEPRPPEVAETLSLPPGLHGQAVPLDAVPKSVAEARVLFTLLSRSLGRVYRERHGVILRTDASGIEHMQTYLRDRFTVPAIRSVEEASEVRSHGALLSEILGRTFGAEWSDIAPSELGYWAMTTPSGLRIWPFGRILRFILQGHHERDLVSYYLELEARLRMPR